MSLWLLLLVGVLLGFVLLAVGVHMIRPSWNEQGTRADVGVAVITTTVISLAIFILQILDENRLERQDETRQEQSANQSLRLQLGLTSSLRGIDLSSKDLHGIFLPQKNLEAADFSDSDLSDANLEKARLTGCDLQPREPRGRQSERCPPDAALTSGTRGSDGSKTVLDNADLTGAELLGAQLQKASLSGADLRGATATDANFRGAVTSSSQGVGMYYNGNTVFPDGKKHPLQVGSLHRSSRNSRPADRR